MFAQWKFCTHKDKLFYFNIKKKNLKNILLAQASSYLVNLDISKSYLIIILSCIFTIQFNFKFSRLK